MYPLTISVQGTTEQPLFLKISLYNMEDMQEKSLIYTIEESSWRISNESDSV